MASLGGVVARHEALPRLVLRLRRLRPAEITRHAREVLRGRLLLVAQLLKDALCK